MAELNYRLQDTLEHLFYRQEDRDSNYRLGSWENNNILNRLICCNLGRGTIEIPLIMKPHVESIINGSRLLPISILDNRTVVAPIISDHYISDKRTADSIIRYFFDRHLGSGMGYVRTNKGLEYYGGLGYILDGNYNVLMFITLSGKIIGDTAIAGFTYTGATVYINPSVLTSNDIVSKALLKKIIPFMVNNNSFPIRMSGIIHRSEFFKIKVVIENRDDFFMMPQPSQTEGIDESINTMLNDNIEGVLGQL